MNFRGRGGFCTITLKRATSSSVESGYGADPADHRLDRLRYLCDHSQLLAADSSPRRVLALPARSPVSILLPAWIAMWLLLAAVTAHWRDLAIYHRWWCWIPASMLFGAGLALYRLSSRGFSQAQLSGLPEVLPGSSPAAPRDHGHSRTWTIPSL